jgi:hypothetical protein
MHIHSRHGVGKKHLKVRQNHLIQTPNDQLQLWDHALRFACQGTLLLSPVVTAVHFVGDVCAVLCRLVGQRSLVKVT